MKICCKFFSKLRNVNNDFLGEHLLVHFPAVLSLSFRWPHSMVKIPFSFLCERFRRNANSIFSIIFLIWPKYQTLGCEWVISGRRWWISAVVDRLKMYPGHSCVKRKFFFSPTQQHKSGWDSELTHIPFGVHLRVVNAGSTSGNVIGDATSHNHIAAACESSTVRKGKPCEQLCAVWISQLFAAHWFGFSVREKLKSQCE